MTSRGANSSAASPFASGSYLIAFVLFASDCGFSTLPASEDAIAKLRSTLRKSHGESFAAVQVVAVDLDADVKPGLQFISQLEHRGSSPLFDQVIVGGSWLNEEFVKIAWQGGIIDSNVPRVLVVARPVDASAYVSKGVLSVGADSVLANVVGASDIVAWVAGGAQFAPGHRPTDLRGGH